MKEIKIIIENPELNKQIKNLGCLINLALFYFGLLPIIAIMFGLIGLIVSILLGDLQL